VFSLAFVRRWIFDSDRELGRRRGNHGRGISSSRDWRMWGISHSFSDCSSSAALCYAAVLKGKKDEVTENEKKRHEKRAGKRGEGRRSKLVV
jgi:hypothetical protein